MTNLPLVSIIIPCFNRETEIKDAINSALAQTYSNIEIIVVDDGSTDNSIQVVEQYGEQVKLIAQTNKGVSSARNTGFASAQGEFIVFLDSDDWLSTDIIEQHIYTAKKWPNVDIYCANSTSVDEDGQLTTVKECNWPDRPDTPLKLFLLYPPPFPACEMYRSSTIKKFNGYDEDMRGFADSGLRLKIILSGGKVVRTNGGYAVYRPVANSITKNPLKLHYYAVKLVNKLKRSPHIKNDTNIRFLLKERLLKHRLRWWKTILSYHIKWHPKSLAKFIYYLFKLIKIDPGYILFIFRDKPWKMKSKEFF